MGSISTNAFSILQLKVIRNLIDTYGGGGGSGGLTYIFDGGAPDTVYTLGPVFDCGGVEA